MTEKQQDFNSIQQESTVQLSPTKFKPRQTLKNQKKTPLKEQVSRPPKNAIKLIPPDIPVHFTWALVMTILCFFIIGPVWALYKTIKLRRMIRQGEINDTTKRLSDRITTVLIISTIVGIMIWVGILFCSVGILLAGQLLKSDMI